MVASTVGSRGAEYGAGADNWALWSPGCSFLLIVLPRSDKIETELFYWGKLPTLTTHNRYLVAHWPQP